MRALNIKLFKLPQVFVIFAVLLFLFPSIAMARQAVMSGIQILNNPWSVKFSISKSIPVKVIQVEKKELVIAMRNVALGKYFKITGKENSVIKNIAVEKLQGDVIAVVLTSKQPFIHIKSGFDSSSGDFVVSLGKKEIISVPVPKKNQIKKEISKPVEKTIGKSGKSDQLQSIGSPVINDKIKQPHKVKTPKKKTLPKPPPVVKSKSKEMSSIPEPLVYVPPDREQSLFKGDLSDLILVVEDAKCDSTQVANAMALLRKNKNKEALNILDQYLGRESVACLEAAYFLRAYAFYRQVQEEDFAQWMKAEKYFQDALVSYPTSAYVPYGYSAIGMIQKKLSNTSAAEGYFNIVKQGYLAYSGLSEIMYHLAGIYAQKGYLDKALRYYKQVFEDTVENNYIADAGIGYGKALYQKKQYLKTLSVLNYVVESAPEKVYESHELLLHIGNANYEVGQSKAARVALTRVMNLFEKIENPDVILSKVGDTYGMENNEEKAIKIYELVREKYPDSKGYIASSIGIARYLKTDKEKIEIYKMIKTKFPENTYARIAMMRLAEIYQANGEYNKCINEVIDLLSTQPRGLRYEAVKLMQRAYEALFKKQLKSGEYTKVLNRYELDHTKIDRMGSRQIAFSVGMAYLEAKLYEEAFNHLLTAYKQYKRSSRSSRLLFGLGMAMVESGRDDDALKLFNAFAKRFPKNKNRVEALLQSGGIYLDKKKYKPASKKFNDAYRVAKKRLDKGRILILHSAVYENKGDMKTASLMHEKAVKELALATGENYGILTEAYKELGRIYISLKLYVKAADAYVKALSFSDDDGEKANLGFLLGDAYQKGNILPKARQAYQQVAQTYDSVWARLAQQRLNTLELANIVRNS
ncbi:MAG: tetratricopeptide repeat protein [Desulfobacula sp.]|nr:tetratricopeptide repeat protein [Desulfobacula sp.]